MGETFILRARRVLIKELSLVVCLPVPQEDVSQRTASCGSSRLQVCFATCEVSIKAVTHVQSGI